VTDVFFDSPAPPYWEASLRTGGFDVAWGGGPTLFDIMASKGFFEGLSGETVMREVAHIPDSIGGVRLKSIREGKLIWVAAAISSFGIVVNKPFLERHGLPMPTDWTDLGRPEYGKNLPIPSISMADPLGSTSHTRIYEIILQAYGWDDGWRLITRIAANARIEAGSTEALLQITSGNVGLGPAIDFYGYGAHAENPNIVYVLPRATIVNGDPIALVASSTKKEAALAFIAFVLSVEGQKLWLHPKISRLPVREEVFATPEGLQRPDIKAAFEAARGSVPVEFSDELAISYEFTLQNYFKAALIDQHAPLVRAWKALIDALNQGKISRERFESLAARLGEPLTITIDGVSQRVSQDYAIQVNGKLAPAPSGDEAFRIKFLEAVRMAAEARYREILGQVSG